MSVNITQEEYREWLRAMSDDRLTHEFVKCTDAMSSDRKRAETSARELLTDVYCREADSEESAEKWQRAEKTASRVDESRDGLDRSYDRLTDTAHEMNRRSLNYGRDTLDTAMNENYQRYRQASQVIERSLNKFEDARERREAEGDSWKKDKGTNEEYRKSLAGLSNYDLVEEFKHRRDVALDRDAVTGQVAKISSRELREIETRRQGVAAGVGQGIEWLDHASAMITELDRQTERDYDRLRSTVDEMKNRDDLTFSGRERHESRAQFEEIRDRGIQRSTDTKERIDEFHEVKGRIDKPRENSMDSTVSHNQADDRRPNLTQSDPDRGQKRDDAEFLGREAAHVLPQGERDRQRDAARFQNPEEERGREQELKPEMSLGGASSEPQTPKERGGQEQAPAQAGQKEEAKAEKAPVSALGKAEARFNSRDEKARPGEQKEDEQKAEQATEAKKPVSALGRAAAYFNRKEAEQPKTVEEQSRRM